MATKKVASRSKKNNNAPKTTSRRGRSATKKNNSTTKKTVSKKNKNTPKKPSSRGRSVTKKNNKKSVTKKNNKKSVSKRNVAKNVRNYPAVFEKDGSFFRVTVCAKKSVDGIVLPPKCITKTFYKKLTNKDSSHLPTLPVHMRPQLPVFPVMGL